MQTFEEFYAGKMLEEQMLEEGFKEIVDAIGAFPGDVAAYAASIGDYGVNLGLAGVGGVVAAQGLGALFHVIADKMDAERNEEVKDLEGKKEIMITSEFEKAKEIGKKLSEEQQMKLLDDISEKWAEKYNIPKPKLFVKVMRKLGDVLRSKIGTAIAGVLAFLAAEMLIPFPTF